MNNELIKTESTELNNGSLRIIYENTNYAVFIIKEDNSFNLIVQELKSDIPFIFIREDNEFYLPSYAVLNIPTSGSINTDVARNLIEELNISIDTVEQINLMIKELRKVYI